MREESHDQRNNQVAKEDIYKCDVRGIEQTLLGEHVIDHDHGMNQIGGVRHMSKEGETSPREDGIDQGCHSFVRSEDDPSDGQGPSDTRKHEVGRVRSSCHGR